MNNVFSEFLNPVAASELIFAHELEVSAGCLEQKRNRPNGICCYLFVRGHLNLASGPTGEKIGVEAASRFAMETDCFVLQHEGIS